MERTSAALAWGFHYMPNTPPIIRNLGHNLYQDAREKSLDPRYTYSPMSAERPGSYITPCYWPPHYSGPYGVGQHGTAPTAAKRSGMNPCECSACVTTSPPPYKPMFVPHPNDSRKIEVTPSGLCMTDDGVDAGIGTGPRRGRTVFTAQQLQVLERVFSTTQYIVGSQRKFLANQLRLSETQVRVWFQNRRIKWRKQMLTRSING
ncbi:hypothetical protein QZH41_005033 [Actinostola sp. cb2023]|nr:hypothetical protein QZH41_005033 [Actinostola sp. cb2023]